MSLRLALKILLILFLIAGLSILFLYLNRNDIRQLRENEKKVEVDSGPSEKGGQATTTTGTEKEGEKPKSGEEEAKELIETDLKDDGEVDQETREKVQQVIQEEVKQQNNSNTEEQQQQEERQAERREIMEEVNENIE